MLGQLHLRKSASTGKAQVRSMSLSFKQGADAVLGGAFKQMLQNSRLARLPDRGRGKLPSARRHEIGGSLGDCGRSCSNRTKEEMEFLREFWIHLRTRKKFFL